MTRKRSPEKSDAGVEVVWDTAKAQQEATPSRERICLNGLWRWQPGNAGNEEVPTGRWGFFKVPGCWPGITDYMQKDSQRVYAHPDWSNERFGELKAAWYEREFAVPAGWEGRRIALSLEYLNSYAVVYVNRKRVGEIRFPGGGRLGRFQRALFIGGLCCGQHQPLSWCPPLRSED